MTWEMGRFRYESWLGADKENGVAFWKYDVRILRGGGGVYKDVEISRKCDRKQSQYLFICARDLKLSST